MLPLRTKDELLPLIVGILSLILAFLVAALDAAYGVNAPRSSISHYFYAPIAGTSFVVILAFIAAFMFAYRGQSWIDGWLTTFGAICALLVAIFPTANLGVGVGEEFDYRLIADRAAVISGEEVLATNNPSRDGFLSAYFAQYVTRETIVSEESVTVNGQEVIVKTERVVLVGNERSQLIHQLGAVGVIGSLILLSIVHVFRKSWVVYNVQKDQFLARTVGRKERVFTSICIIFMLIGAWLASGFWVDGANTVSIWVSYVSLSDVVFGNEFSGIPRPVYHGERFALFFFGCAWLIQSINYFRFRRALIH